MIVESYITVRTNRSADAIPDHGISMLRWLCDALIGDETLGEQISMAAQAQVGLSRHAAIDPVTMLWARRLVIKDCIAVARPARRTEIAAAGQDTTAPTDALCLRLRRLGALPRFVYVLREIEGLSSRQVAALLNVSEAECETAYLTAIDALRRGVVPGRRCNWLTTGPIHNPEWRMPNVSQQPKLKEKG